MVKLVRDIKELKNCVEFFVEDSKKLFTENLKVNKVYEGCLWAEGPVYLKNQNIIVWSDIPFNRMLYYSLDSHKTGSFRNPSNFSNGNSLDLNGNQITAEHGRRAISKTNKYGDVEVIANKFQNKKLNSPNDLVCKSDGTIWFTDPQYGIMSNYEGYESTSEIGFNGVYMIDKNNIVNLMTKEIDAPNGIAFSNDEKKHFLETIKSISFEMSKDLLKSKSKFLEKYGHLRPNTYEISTPSYRENYKNYFKKIKPTTKRPKKFIFSNKQKNKINRLLKTNNFKKINADLLINFIENSIYERESSKLFFTKIVNIY